MNQGFAKSGNTKLIMRGWLVNGKSLGWFEFSVNALVMVQIKYG